MTAKSDKLVLSSAEAVLNALRKRYDGNAWALFENVSNATGGRASRWADALVMSLWPSRGLDIHGVEIKVSRSDMMRELQDPQKAEAVASYCDYWWVAVGSASIVKIDELPRTWGLLVPISVKGVVTMKAVKEAAKLKPKALDRGFLASILRRASEQYNPERIRQDLRAEVYEQVEAAAAERHASQHQREVSGLREYLAEEKKLNAELTRQIASLTDKPFSPVALGNAIDLLHRLNGWRGAEKSIEDLLQALHRDVHNTTETLKTALELVKTMNGANEKTDEGSGSHG